MWRMMIKKKEQALPPKTAVDVGKKGRGNGEEGTADVERLIAG
jgi:hypothetical protein